LEDKLLERLVALRSQDWDEGIFNCIYEHMNYELSVLLLRTTVVKATISEKIKVCGWNSGIRDTAVNLCMIWITPSLHTNQHLVLRVELCI